MGNPTYIIRNYHAEDFDTLVQLTTEVQELGQTGCLISPLDLIERVGQPNHSSEKDLFIAGRAGEIVGFADVRPELEIGRTVLRLLVHPKHHNRRLAAKLVDRAISRTRELGLVTLHVNILHDSPVAKQLLTKMGFTLIREFLELRLDLSKTDLPEISNTAPRCRSLQPGEEEKLTQLQNRSFTGSWGYNVNTVEEIIYRISLPNSFPEDILLAFDSDKPIGYCWTRISFWKNKTSGEGSGRITMLGVDPDYRGRGLGRHILLDGLSYLKRKDLRVVEVTVDSENPVAYALYKSVGFEFWTSSLWYEKRLD